MIAAATKKGAPGAGVVGGDEASPAPSAASTASSSEVPVTPNNDSIDSPPNSNYRTSSPSKRKAGKNSGSRDVTPGMSIIAVGGRESAQLSSQKRDTSASRSQERGSGAAEDRSSRLKFNLPDEAESSDEDSDDDQPSAKRTIHKSPVNRYTKITPLRHNTSARSKSIQVSRENERGVGEFIKGTATVFLIFFLVAVASIVYEPTDCDEKIQSAWNDTQRDFRHGLSALRKEFPGQDPKTWAVIKSSVSGVLKDDPQQPAVLLFASWDDDASPTAKCLTMRTAALAGKVLGSSAGVSSRGAATFSDKNELFDTMDLELFDKMAFVLDGIESLPGSVAMALHAFCDNLNAPHKRAVIGMSINLEGSGEVSVDKAVEEVLTEKWNDELDVDRISPILSRITVSVVGVKREKEAVCEKH